MGYIVIFKRLAGIPNVALLVRPIVHTFYLDLYTECRLVGGYNYCDDCFFFFWFSDKNSEVKQITIFLNQRLLMKFAESETKF